MTQMKVRKRKEKKVTKVTLRAIRELLLDDHIQDNEGKEIVEFMNRSAAYADAQYAE